MNNQDSVNLDVPEKMQRSSCDAIMVTCMDFRFQEYIEQWQQERFGKYVFDRVSLAGSVFDLFAVLKHVEISNSLHHIRKVVLINHEDCGAYGEQGTKDRHLEDLRRAEEKIESLYPHLDVEAYFLHLNGDFELVPEATHMSSY